MTSHREETDDITLERGQMTSHWGQESVDITRSEETGDTSYTR